MLADPSLTRLHVSRSLVNFFESGRRARHPGTLLIPPVRSAAAIQAAIAAKFDVLGQYKTHSTWNHDSLQAKLQRDPITDDGRQGAVGVRI